MPLNNFQLAMGLGRRVLRGRGGGCVCMWGGGGVGWGLIGYANTNMC